MGFNMLDPVVGGLTSREDKLRQALSIVIDQEEFISIFMNRRGIAAMNPLPPGILGHLDVALQLVSENSIIATELAAVLDELKFQLDGLEREIHRQVPVWMDTLDPITSVALNEWRLQLRECNSE